MFDLESKIRDWKSNLTCSSSMTHKNSEELESHLRDSYAELVKNGLRENEAFLIASMRLGTPGELSREFRKVNGAYASRRCAIWLILGWLGGNALSTSISGLGTIVGAGAAWAGFGGALTGFVSVAVTLVCWAIALFAFWQSGRRGAESSTTNTPVSLTLLISLIACLGFGQALMGAGFFVYSKQLSAEQLGHAMLWTAIGGMGVFVGVVVTCAAIILSFRRMQIDEEEVVA